MHLLGKFCDLEGKTAIKLDTGFFPPERCLHPFPLLLLCTERICCVLCQIKWVKQKSDSWNWNLERISFLAKGTPLFSGLISTDDSAGKEYLINNILWALEIYRCSGCYHGPWGTVAAQPAHVKWNRAIPSPAVHVTVRTWKIWLYKDMANSFLAFCATGRCLPCPRGV